MTSEQNAAIIRLAEITEELYPQINRVSVSLGFSFATGDPIFDEIMTLVSDKATVNTREDGSVHLTYPTVRIDKDSDLGVSILATMGKLQASPVPLVVEDEEVKTEIKNLVSIIV